MSLSAERIRVQGTVQGVGFRPTVWRFARECGVRGSVLNDAQGVLIHAWGEPRAIAALAGRIEREPPPLSRVDAVIREVVDCADPPADFRILESSGGDTDTNVAGDAATCPDCLADIRDPENRRYRYPFTNCTHCGPRLSIARAVPYDRANTSMAAFTMCEACRSEYEDPADRRFHAQPNACPECGPRVWLEGATPARDDDALRRAGELIRAGGILAVKGLGGFHLACDATRPDAVAELRRRKRRYSKALALMARDVETIRRYARVSPDEARLLASPAAPIVVLAASGAPLPETLAPGQDTLGFMLPYTPLHHLLLEETAGPVVMTSGNVSDEPQVIDNADARERLAGIADAFLMHDRDIVNRLDDSVAMIAGGEPRILRRARGYAPEPVKLPEGFEAADGILAMGGELKNTFCLVSRGRAIVSQHIGDMDDARAATDARRNLDLYRRLYDFEPNLVAVDQHPDYLPTQSGPEAAEVLPVQHHHAHIASCLIEHGTPRDAAPVLGIALDGLGYGADGTLWGGEFLLADYREAERLGHFLPVVLPGGERAMREPWRNAWAHLDAAFGWSDVVRDYGDLDSIRWLDGKPLHILATMRDRGLNSPPASSAGRLFDAVAAVLGVCREQIRHEAEAAMALEAMAARSRLDTNDPGYPAELRRDGIAILSWRPLWEALLIDLRDSVRPGIVAARFHAGVARAVADLGIELADRHGLHTIVLSGGVFQNRLLLEAVSARLESAGRRVLLPRRMPANDGGLSLGQAAVAAARRPNRGDIVE